MERIAMNECCMKPALLQWKPQHRNTTMWTHTITHTPPTIYLTSAYTCQLFNPHSSASLLVNCANSEEQTNATQHDRSRWSGCREGGEENKQIAGEAKGPWLLTKCPPDVAGLLPTPHLMASCANTLPVGGRTLTALSKYVQLKFIWFVWAANVI